MFTPVEWTQVLLLTVDNGLRPVATLPGLLKLVKLKHRLDELKGNQLTGTNLLTVLWIRDLHEFLELSANSG